MARVQTMVQLSSDMIEALDAEAARVGQSRSSLIRSAVDAYLATSRERAITKQLVDGYTSIPQGADDEWGNVLDASRSATKRTLQRLDEEEKAAGFSW